MARRFTEDTKWRDKWFNRLSAHAKLIWIYLCDNCSRAGIYELDFRIMAFDTGMEQCDVEHGFNQLKEKLLINNDHVYLKNFILHQYPKGLHPNNNAHKGVISELKECLFTEYSQEILKRFLLDSNESQKSVSGDSKETQGRDPGKDKGTDKEKDKGTEKDKEIYSEHFLEFWKVYPKKDGKKAAYRIWIRNVKSEYSAKIVILAATNYAAYKAGSDYIKAAATFLNSEDMSEWQSSRGVEKRTGSKGKVDPLGKEWEARIMEGVKE